MFFLRSGAGLSLETAARMPAAVDTYPEEMYAVD